MADSARTQPNALPGRSIVPCIAIPMIAGAVSLLAVINSAPHKENLVGTAIGFCAWYIVACALLFLMSKVSPEDLIKWSPVAGALGILVLIVGALTPALLYNGIHGTVVLYPTKGIYGIPWHLCAPVYIAWLVRFSPARLAPDSISWNRFGLFCIAGAVWLIPLMLIPSVSAVTGFLVLFLVICWLDNITLDKLLAATFLGAVLVTITAYRSRVLTEFEVSEGLLKTAFGTGGLFGRGDGDAFKTAYFLPWTDGYTVFLSTIEGIGTVGLLAVVGCLVAVVAWGLRRSAVAKDMERLMVQLIIVYLSVQGLTFLWSATGLLPKADFTFPLFSGSGCELVATMFMLKVILSQCTGRQFN